MQGEIVDGNLHRPPFPQLQQMLDHQLRFQRIRVVEIDFLTFFVGQVTEIAIVSVMGDVGDVFRPHALQNPISHGSLARSCAPSYTDDQWPHDSLPS